MNAEIICVGTEILLGDIVNTNASFIAKELANCGVNVFYQSVVGDNPKRLEEALVNAIKRSDFIVTTGGLGPTYDDLTKETLAKLFNKSMHTDQKSLDHIMEFFKKYNFEMTPNNLKQAEVPDDCIVLHNENGTAPGILLEDNGVAVAMLPGPPREMKPMFNDYVLPYCAKKTGTILVSKNVQIFGIGESIVETILKEKMISYTNPTIAPYAKDGEVRLRVTASAKNEKEAYDLIDPVVAEISEIFKDNIYGIDVDSLAQSLVVELTDKNLKVATAESCTGGTISQFITEVSGSSNVFDCGVCSYANFIKEGVLGVKKETLESFGAVSEQTAIEMANGVRNLSGADIGISTTGIAGPTGGSEEKPVGLVYVGVSSKFGSFAVKLMLSRNYSPAQERAYIRLVASNNALFLALKEGRKF